MFTFSFYLYILPDFALYSVKNKVVYLKTRVMIRFLILSGMTIFKLLNKADIQTGFYSGLPTDSIAVSTLDICGRWLLVAGDDDRLRCAERAACAWRVCPDQVVWWSLQSYQTISQSKFSQLFVKTLQMFNLNLIIIFILLLSSDPLGINHVHARPGPSGYFHDIRHSVPFAANLFG